MFIKRRKKLSIIYVRHFEKYLRNFEECTCIDWNFLITNAFVTGTIGFRFSCPFFYLLFRDEKTLAITVSYSQTSFYLKKKEHFKFESLYCVQATHSPGFSFKTSSISSTCFFVFLSLLLPCENCLAVFTIVL